MYFVFEQVFGVFYIVEIQVVDIGFGCDKGYWYVIVQFFLVQFGFQDEQEFISWFEVGCILDGVNDDWVGIGCEFFEGFVSL